MSRAMTLELTIEGGVWSIAVWWGLTYALNHTL
jgi:hypothetical protein